MQDIITLYCNNCNLGSKEIYNDNLENDGKNPETDSLSCLNL